MMGRAYNLHRFLKYVNVLYEGCLVSVLKCEIECALTLKRLSTYTRATRLCYKAIAIRQIKHTCEA